ncbi:hypothetical protein [Hugenholtzia roseola]|uniref:hypothetical protein n=1 Tax=Hugenholtzia roseola TaxID=1002 RepID=UPI0004063C8D|nr:hypothetical protein [Hugenholtzia roseola]
MLALWLGASSLWGQIVAHSEMGAAQQVAVSAKTAPKSSSKQAVQSPIAAFLWTSPTFSPHLRHHFFSQARAEAAYAHLAQFSFEMRERYSRLAPKEALRRLFFSVQKRFLKSYEAYPLLEETLLEGKYDCLSVTALFAFVLEEMQMAHQIYETPNHVYLVVIFSEKDRVLIETTDALNGFVDNEAQITERIRLYSQAENELVGRELNSLLTLEELAGLQLHNQAIKQYQAGKKALALALAEQAATFYTKARNENLSRFLIDELLQDPQTSVQEKVRLFRLRQTLFGEAG